MLNPEERAMVAKAVTDSQYSIIGDVLHNTWTRWRPGYDSHQWKLLVEWLADKIYFNSEVRAQDLNAFNQRCVAVLHAIITKDTAALEQLVYELMEAQ